MPGLDVNATVPVKDVMSIPVVTVADEGSILDVAELMDEFNVGSIVVVDSERRPVGIITERDVVIRVAKKNLQARKVTAKNIMTSPLITITPEADIKEAAERMRRHNIRRLIVMERGEMVGFVSDKDIVEITPALVEIISETTRITQATPSPRDFNTIGYCERCNQWSTSLISIEGSFICEECRIELGEEP